jgi:diguanylate cyclase (GGDEF)-like protein
MSNERPPAGPGDAPPSWEDPDASHEQTITKETSADPRTRRGEARPCLLVIAGANAGELFPIRQGETLLGRSRQAKVLLDDEGISRRHAAITRERKLVRISDLGSANGTFVNDERVDSPRVLMDGDKILLGSVTILKFTYNDELDERFQKRMRDAALRDGLTGIYNKKHFLERLETEFAYAVRHRAPLSLLTLDIDHFKQVNDTYGHSAGDAVLVATAQGLATGLRREDVFARCGGEEFGIICRGVTVEGARILAERLREIVMETAVPYEDHTIRVTISIGVAGFPDGDLSTAMGLYESADHALYDAKAQGRNRVVIKEPG